MGGLFSKPKTPKVAPPAPLPDEDALKKARKKSIATSAGRSGRKSTILSDKETLG